MQLRCLRNSWICWVALINVIIIVKIESVVLTQEGENARNERSDDLANAIETCDSHSECQDSEADCSFWASEGECETNPKYMKKQCRASCGTCDVDVTDNHVNDGENWNVDEKSARMGKPQVLDPGDLDLSTWTIQEVINKALVYVESGALGTQLVELCQNKHEFCAVWAAMGECQANSLYMETSCAPVCHSCDKLTIEGRCPLDPNATNAWGPGDLNQMFERLSSEPFLSQHDVQILSSPTLNNGPWIITMENVVTAEEATRLIELGNVEGYEQSMEVDEPGPDGVLEEMISEDRTSYNAWCQNECYQDEIALRVIHRLSDITGIEEANSEYLQLLRYEPGQYYKSHHDYVPSEVERQQGPRILTVFLYLNDVEEGGETEFTFLDLRVTPKVGRALLWPNVLDKDPHQGDPRTEHQALAVKMGVKYGANAWFHQRDFKVRSVSSRCWPFVFVTDLRFLHIFMSFSVKGTQSKRVPRLMMKNCGWTTSLVADSHQANYWHWCLLFSIRTTLTYKIQLQQLLESLDNSIPISKTIFFKQIYMDVNLLSSGLLLANFF